MYFYFFGSPENNKVNTLSLIETRRKNEAFGSSLLLSNSPLSPKVVNGSFAAIFDEDEFLAKAYSGIRITVIIFLTSHCRLLNLSSQSCRIRIPQPCDEEYVV